MEQSATHGVLLSLTGLELFFIVTTLISLGFNVLQWRESKASKEPLASALISIFNDIKSKSNVVLFSYNALFNPANPHKDIDTLRWECGLFMQNVLAQLQGFQEQVVGMLVSLRPDDVDGKLVFRATEYGLTQQDKDLRQQNFERIKAQMAAGSSVGEKSK